MHSLNTLDESLKKLYNKESPQKVFCEKAILIHLKSMLEAEDIDGMRAMMRHSTARRALFDKK